MNTRLIFLDKLIPNSILNDASECFKARTLIIMVSILVLLATISMTLIIAVDKSLPTRRLITISLISLQPFSIWLMWQKKKILQAAWYVVSLLAVTVMYIDYNNESFKGAFSIIWMLPTTIAVMLLGGRAALKVTFISIIGIKTPSFLGRKSLLSHISTF